MRLTQKTMSGNPGREPQDEFCLNGTVATADWEATASVDDLGQQTDLSAVEDSGWDLGLPCDWTSPPDLYLG
jgi:hypothetical protein